MTLDLRWNLFEIRLLCCFKLNYDVVPRSRACSQNSQNKYSDNIYCGEQNTTVDHGQIEADLMCNNTFIKTSSYPRSPDLCPEAVVDCVGKPRISIQCSCLIAPPRGYGSALLRTRMLLPNTGRKIADWSLRGFIQCANIQVLLARSITASVHKFGGCGYDDAIKNAAMWLAWS